MSTLKTSEKIWIGICVLVVLVAVWIKLKPSGAAGAQHALLPPDQARHKTEVALHTITRLGSEQADLKSRTDQMVYNDPPDQLVPRVIRDLQKIADRAGVHLHEIKPGHIRDASTNGVTRVPLEVRFSASFQPNVMRFLYYVEDPAGKMAIDKLALTPADMKFKTVDVDAQIIVFTRATAAVAGAEGGRKNVISKVD